MEAIQVIDTSHLVPLAGGKGLMIGAPPEALKVLLLWEYPLPCAVVLPPDPLYAEGVNQASFEFLLYNHLFQMNGLRDRVPFIVVCDPAQQTRVETMIRHMLRGPSEAEMAAWRTPARLRRQLLLETAVVSGEVSTLRLDQMARVIPFRANRAALPDGTLIENLSGHRVRVTSAGETVTVPRTAQSRAALPLYFPDVEKPVAGPRLGLQVIGSASGFSGSEWGSCYIVWINGQALIIDGTPYLQDHLRRLGIEEEQILGYLITHNHEDHANTIGQLVGRRPVTVLTSGPVMSGLIARLAAVLECPTDQVRRLFRWVPLQAGLESYGEPLQWFGAEIRTWYSVHTIPTLGVDISMGGRHIRMPGDTLWGRQLEPLLEKKIISKNRYDFILHTYDGADVIVADAGGGPIHPDPEEVHELLSHANGSQMMVTHIPEFARPYLPIAEPGTVVTLLPRVERTPEDALALFGSPVLRNVPERWLLALLYGGEVESLGDGPAPNNGGALFLLSGSVTAAGRKPPSLTLQRGDVFHPSLAPGLRDVVLTPTSTWTRVLRVPEDFYQSFVTETGIQKLLDRLFRTRNWWAPITGGDLALETLVNLAALSREREFEKGAAIVRQGDRARHFFVVTRGSVEVLSRKGSDEHVIGRFGPGFHFGEIALLGTDNVRTATVRAVEEVSVLELPIQAFRRHLMGIPIARYRIGRTAAHRKSELSGDP